MEGSEEVTPYKASGKPCCLHYYIGLMDQAGAFVDGLSGYLQEHTVCHGYRKRWLSFLAWCWHLLCSGSLDHNVYHSEPTSFTTSGCHFAWQMCP